MGNTVHKGVVVKTTGSWYTVRKEDNTILSCRIRGKFRIKGIKTTNPIAVGDEILFFQEEGLPTGIITEVLDRRNCIIRKSTKLSKQKHILAANIDQACLVVTLAFPRTSTGFIDRFLVTAGAYHVPVLICFNKIDLYNKELQQFHDEVFEMYTQAGYTCLALSVLEKKNIDTLISYLKGKTTFFSGHSGSGKSALINAIDPTIHLRTGAISTWSMKGKHTTTFAEMVSSSVIEGNLIDSPGIKEFGMVDFSKEELSHYFPEMQPYIPLCKFHNCTHWHEPNCAVKQAVEDGHIHSLRYNNYINIRNGEEMELQEWELK